MNRLFNHKAFTVVLVGVALLALVAGIFLPTIERPPSVYVSATRSETNWPFRYVIYGKPGARRGHIERRTSGDWKYSEPMHIYKKDKGGLAFKTYLDQSGNQSTRSWHLDLIKDTNGLTGTLTGDSWDNASIQLSFRHVPSM
jgi:hypothetical protein